jgi:hypothetical protein
MKKRVIKAEQVDQVVDKYFEIVRGTKKLTKEQIEALKKEMIDEQTRA